MTAPLIEAVDLSDFEFSIQCEEPGCRDTADVMAKGCSDHDFHGLCFYHLAAVKKRFDNGRHKTVCNGCNRPWLFFETHYTVADI